MVSYVLRYYAKIAWKYKKYSVPPLFLAPIARIGTEYATPLITAQVLNKITSDSRPDISAFYPYIALFFAIPFFAELLWRYIIWSLNQTDAKGMRYIAEDTFIKLLDKDYTFHTNNFAGALVAKTNRFINAFEPLYDQLVFNILGVFVPFIFVVGVLFTISAPVAGIFCVALFLYVLVIVRLTRKRMKLNTLRAEAESIQTGNLADSLSNAITVKTFAHEKHELRIYKKSLQNLYEKRLKSWDYQNYPMDVFTTNIVITMNSIALAGALIATYRYGLPAGSLFIVITYVLRLTGRLWDVSRLLRDIEKNLSDAVEMAQILHQRQYIQDKKSAADLIIKDGELDIEKVAFDYRKGSKSQLFNNLNFHIPAGQRVGLVGPSGGGKTTITKLLLRFMDVRDGAIRIDGQDISTVTQDSLRRAITYVPQEPLLFHRTIMENIAYAKPTATHKEIIEAAKKANAHEFIHKLSNGYETLVGERGIKLSGGQRQRIAIARAILKDSPIIVLDEATSALDSESEKLIQEALFRLMDGKTTIVIAHRLSTIKNLDRIIVLEDGSITEEGTHDELFQRKNGTYARLWAHQSGGFIEE